MSGEELHDQFAEDAAAYVLGALTEPEQQAFAVHLETCAVCRDEVASLQRVASVLPAAVPQMASPGELKDRVMATVHSEAALRDSRRSEAPARSEPRGLSRLGARSLFGSLAGAVAVAVIAVAVASSGGGTPARVIRAQVTVPQASVSVRVSGGHAELDVAGMPQSPPDHVYEVWIKKTGPAQPTDALFTVNSAGSATVGVPGSIAGVKQIMVTAEPRGGSRVPTSTPVIVASL
jgi:anti-sigma-K factor RskA